MSVQSSLRYGAFVLVIALFTTGIFSAYAQPASNVSRGIQLSRDLGLADPTTEVNITVHLTLNNKAAFDKAVDALYDPASPTFHQWMKNSDLIRFAPTAGQRQIVRQELQKYGLTILSTDKLGFSIRAHGTIGNVESAFHTEIHQFEYNGRTYSAHVRDARLSGIAGDYVESVGGLERHQIRPMAVRARNPITQKPLPTITLGKLSKGSGFPAGSTTNCLSAPATETLQGSSALPTGTYTGTTYNVDSATTATCTYLPNQLWGAYGLSEVFAAGYNGAGETVVLVEGYGYPTLEKDANTFSQLGNLPQFTASNFSIVYPQGKTNLQLGITTGWNVEMAIDIDSAHTVAPGAKIVEVFTSGQDNEDFQDSISYVVENDLGNTVSNSYEEDLDLIAGSLEQTSWDDVLEVAAAKGVSVNFSSGDSGDNGVGSPLGAPGVPSDAPHATSVGGTSILNDLNNPGSTITTAWGNTWGALEVAGTVSDPPPGYTEFYAGGGGGESVFWPKPSWQKSLPGTGRQTPDVSALADPFTGVAIVVTEGTAQTVQYGWGGTSLACPIFSAFWALANEKAGHSLGQAAPAIAALPYGSLQDVLPATDSTPNNVTGSVTDASGTTSYTATQLFGDALEGNKVFTSVIWPQDSADVVDFGFGIDTSLTTKKGWDNTTGFGTPYGLTFLNAVTAAAK
jgi:subtilase family serine protease